MKIHIFEIQRKEGTSDPWEAIVSETTLERAREVMKELDSEYPMYSYSIKEVVYSNTTIEYYKKSVYGNDLFYMKDSEQANAVLRLIGQKTISESQMALFEVLGLHFEEVLR